jgi:hypothetical protein
MNRKQVRRIMENKIGCRLARDAYDPELGFYVKDFKIAERPKTS